MARMISLIYALVISVSAIVICSSPVAVVAVDEARRSSTTTTTTRGNGRGGREQQQQQQKQPVKVFLLAGQSNMVGMGSSQHLKILINETCCNEYRRLFWNGTDFTSRDDVFIKYNERQGNLTVGTGFAAPPDRFGPELGFGWTMGDLMADESIVLIKAAYGGRTLAVDFRPPASGEATYKGVHPVHYGWEYRQMITDFNAGLDALPEFYPGYDEEAGYELAGFVWFQGWNDMLNWSFVKEYSFNLANFIRDVRLDMDAPELPFVVGELGMHGVNVTGRGADRVMALRAAEKKVTMEAEFCNTTVFVPTAQYVIANGTAYNGGYHYFGRADTYYHIGKAFGEAMLSLVVNAGGQHSQRDVSRDAPGRQTESGSSLFDSFTFPSLY